MDSEIKGPEPVHRTTLASIMAVHGHYLLRKIDQFTENSPYLCGIPLLYLGSQPLYLFTKKVLSSVWGGILKATGRRRYPTPAEVDYVHAMILNLFNGDDRYDHGRRTVSQRTLGPEYNTMRTADDGVGMLMGAALGAWGGYILGREWRLW